MGRTEIAGFQPQTYKTLQSDTRKTTISQHEINDMGFVQGERIRDFSVHPVKAQPHSSNPTRCGTVSRATIRLRTCSPDTRTGAGSRRATIDARSFSSRHAPSPPSSFTGYDSGP
jgi:hypothetical protein